ncbi:dCTP deaminase [Larkinella sp. GY13]|uniref:dCTP deaminase n=1 Tax=Larkinella sp. GY13 TaxID=3453720 RepID=UPI003EEB5E31
MYLHKEQIIERLRLEDPSRKLTIRPLLDEEEQIGQLTVDFRLGTDFLVSFQGRDAYINATGSGLEENMPISYFFEPTRRKFGETILLHPNQTILCSSLEYIKLPNDIFATLTMRSSYSRLGLGISTIVQAGYCGCISLELTNTNNNPIKLAVGSRLFQARLFQLEKDLIYTYSKRKYVCQVRPTPSKIENDTDLKFLEEMAQI